VRRVASGGEGIGRIRGYDVHLRHGQARTLGQTLHRLVGTGQLLARDRASPVHGERDLVGEEVGDEIHHSGQNQRQKHALLAPESPADEHQQQSQSGQ
jgi:hypothetical protein